MKTFVLIHGAWHASWCWKIIKEKLDHLGHTVYTPNLPGHGDNHIGFSDVDLASYVDFIKNLIEKIHGEIILVGHSMAGVIISQIAEDNPHKIKKLVYVSAFIPDSEGSLADEEKKAYHPSISLEAIIDFKKNTISISHSKKIKDLFYGMCPLDLAEEAQKKLQDQPLKPFLNKLYLANNFEKVPKVYIECLYDQAISLADQRRMNEKIKCEKILLKSDHSPFLSQPHHFVSILESL